MSIGLLTLFLLALGLIHGRVCGFHLQRPLLQEPEGPMVVWMALSCTDFRGTDAP